MANHEAVAAFPVAPSSAAKQLARDMAVRRMAYVVALASEVPSLVAVDPASGAAIIDILCLGRVFHYDSTDTTTAHDGTTCLVSVEGRRYKLASGTDVFAYAVLDKTHTAPPGSPTIGDAYLVATAATGAWVGQDNNVAVLTARGWEFVIFGIGRLLYVENTDTYWHKNASGTWTLGFGAQSLAADSVPPSALIGKPIRWQIENQTTNAPPGTAAVGVQYIIGPSPTGAWAGNAGKLAICEVVNTFTIYTQRTGELAYDKALAKEVRYSGAAWVSGTDALVLIEKKSASASATIDFTTGLDDTYDYYELIISGAKPSVDDVQAYLRVGTGVGPTYQASNYFFTNHIAVQGQTTDTTFLTGTNAAQIGLTWTGGTNGVGNAAGENFSAVIKFNNPEASDFMEIAFNGNYSEARTASASFWGGGRWNTAGAITGIRFLFSGGATVIASGTFALYGHRKS